MGGFGNRSDDKSGGSSYSSQLKSSQKKNKVVDFFRGGGVTGMVVRAVAGQIEKSKAKAKDRKINDTYFGSPDYQGDVSRKPTKDTRTGNDNDGPDRNPPKGIELAKQSTTSATILGPADIQKEAANTIKGPTTTEMTASDILIANKRRGRKTTNITAKKTLAKNFKLSEKTLLG